MVVEGEARYNMLRYVIMTDELQKSYELDIDALLDKYFLSTTLELSYNKVMSSDEGLINGLAAVLHAYKNPESFNEIIIIYRTPTHEDENYNMSRERLLEEELYYRQNLKMFIEIISNDLYKYLIKTGMIESSNLINYGAKDRDVVFKSDQNIRTYCFVPTSKYDYVKKKVKDKNTKIVIGARYLVKNTHLFEEAVISPYYVEMISAVAKRYANRSVSFLEKIFPPLKKIRA